MIEIVAKLSSKHQVTIPSAVRKELGIGAHDTIAFVFGEDRRITVQQPSYTLESVFGSIKGLPFETTDLDQEISQAVAEEMAIKYPDERRR